MRLKEDRQGSALVEAARDLEKLAKGADGAGDSFKGMASDGEKLNAQIEESSKRVKDLQSQIARTGDKSLIGDLKQEQRFLVDLQKISKEMEATAEAAKQVSLEPPVAHTKSLNAELARTRALVESLSAKAAADVSFLPDLKREKSNLRELEKVAADVAATGAKVGTSFIGGIASAFDGAGPILKPALIGGLIALGVALTPVIGAAIGGALSGGIGTVAMAAGLFSASKDPRVQAAASDFGASLSERFFGNSSAFVEPAIMAMRILNRAVADMRLDLAFAKVAPTVEVIATGLGNLGRNLMPGLNTALDRMGPFADVAAVEMGRLGTALGGFMDDVTASPGAVEGLEYVFRLLEGTVVVLGKTISWLGDRFHWFLETGSSFYGAMKTAAESLGLTDVSKFAGDMQAVFIDMLNNAPPAAAAVDGASHAVQSFGTAADAAAGATKKLKDAWDELNGKQMTLDEAMLKAAESAKKIKDTFAEGGKAVQGHSQAVIENRLALYDAAQVAQAAAANYLALTGDTAGAQTILDEFRATNEKAAGATGGNARAVKALNDELYKLPPEKNVAVNVTTYYRTEGSPTQVSNNIKRIDRQTEQYATGGSPRASGGPVLAGMPYQINERAKETVTFPAGGTVHPANLTPMAGGGAVYNVNVYAAPLTSPVETGAAVVQALKQYEMANGRGWRS